MDIREYWRDIPEYKGKYQVSSLGNVRSLNFNRTGRTQNLRKHLDKKGYYMVSLSQNNNSKTYYVHALVAMAFLNHKPNGHKRVIDHKNDIRHDNRVENIQIVTNRYNVNKGFINSDKMAGATWYSPLNKWRARITVNGKYIHLGYFDNKEDAANAYQQALTKEK